MRASLFLFLMMLITIICLYSLLQIKKQHETFVSPFCNCVVSLRDIATQRVNLPYSYDVNYKIGTKQVQTIKDLTCPSALGNKTLKKQDCQLYFVHKLNPSIVSTSSKQDPTEKVDTLVIPCLDMMYCDKEKCFQKQLINKNQIITHVLLTFTKPGQTVSVKVPLLGKKLQSEKMFTLPLNQKTGMLFFRSSVSKETLSGVMFEGRSYLTLNDLLTAVANYQYQTLLGANQIPYNINVTFLNE